MSAISLKFDLPFSIHVDGPFELKASGEDFSVILSTYYEPIPTMLGAESIENVSIVNDEGSSISHTVVIANYTPKDLSAVTDPKKFMDGVPETALTIANALVAALREAYGEYHLDYLHSKTRLGPIACSGAVNGQFDALSGGITFQIPSRSGSLAEPFAKFLRCGAQLSVEQELYFDARRFLLRGNKRMALANLSISFEVRLASLLGTIAASQGDTSLENRINNATLAPLGQEFAKLTLGESLENRGFWGDSVANTFVWLRTARNKVLHKAQMSLSVSSVNRNFEQVSELKAIFSEHDLLVGELDLAAMRVLSGQSAKP